MTLLASAEQGGASVLLKQYSSSGQVIGFGANGYYVSDGAFVLRVEFMGAAPSDPAGIAEDRAVTETNGPTAPCSRVSYRGLWTGISVEYDTPGAGIARSTWRLTPGADPKVIRLHYNQPVKLNADGTLTVLTSGRGVLSESAPIAWQEVDGERRPVEVAFAITGTAGESGGGEVGFVIGAYDTTLPLVIDPTLQWNTFLGSGADEGSGIAVDGSGDVYVTGRSLGPWGRPLRAFHGPSDAFVAKLNASGVLVWNTFLGGSGDDGGYGIAVDGTGNVYVVGTSDATWRNPTREFTHYFDAFVAKLDPNGAVMWNTFLGGEGDDFGSGIAVDRSGNAYVTGTSTATWGSPVGVFAGGNEAFVAKLDASGKLAWNTFLGGPGSGNSLRDGGSGIALDDSGSVYAVGTSDAAWGNPVRAFMAVNSSNAFVARIDAADGTLVWNTFLGGAGDGYGDDGYGIAVDGKGKVYVSGSSDASWGSPVRAFTSRNFDAFAAKLDAGSGSLLWNTFLGGSSADLGSGIAVDGSGSVYLTGASEGRWGHSGRGFSADDAFAAQLNASGALIWHTFLGGAKYDIGLGIAVDRGGNVYLTGTSESTWGSPVRAERPTSDAFVAKIARRTPQTVP